MASKKYDRQKLSDELEKIIFNIDKIDVKSVFEDVRHVESEEKKKEENNMTKYSGKIENIFDYSDFEKFTYLGKKAIQFLEEIVGGIENLTFEEYFDKYAKVYGKEEIESFKNTLYRLKASNVFTIHSLISICKPMGYKVSLLAEEFKKKKDLEVKVNKRRKNNKKYSGRLKINLLPGMEYSEMTKEFIDFINVLGSEGYTFEMLFGELEKNNPDENNVSSKLKSSIDKIIKKDKLTWKTMTAITESLGMELEVEFIKDEVYENDINKFDVKNKIKLMDDDIIRENENV